MTPEIIKALTPLGLAVCATALGIAIIAFKAKDNDAAWVAVGSIAGGSAGMGVANWVSHNKNHE